ncbi:copper resistance protein CopC [Escherichia coli]
MKQDLAPGDYKVDWHAVSDDTHRVKGSYSFSVGR